MKLIVYRPPLDLAMLASYRKLRLAADIQRKSYERTVKQVDTILDKIAGEYCETELDVLDEHRRTLRLITKGTPVTEALAPQDKDPLLRSDPHFNQRQYDAHTQLLKVIYRKLTLRLHPDRGGDRVTWDEVEVAYNMRDVDRLNAIWFSIAEGRNLYWQQSSGVYHVSSEYQRYQVVLEKLKQTPGWQAARLYLAGQVNTAVDIVRLYLADQIAALQNEINYVIKGNENGKEGSQAEGQGFGLVEESIQRSGEGQIERCQIQES